MLKTIIWKNLSAAEQIKILQRPAAHNSASLEQTQIIINQVRKSGDQALKELTQRYDNVVLDKLSVGTIEFIAAENKVSAKVKKALQHAAQQIEKFHQAQTPKNIRVETTTGVYCEMQYRALEKVGLYIPGGTARLPSAVLMLGIPAKIAGCAERILCTPPQKDGSIDPHILYAASLCEIDQVYKVGGAQAIAAMAYGTETIPKVDKIFGPGNSWVTQAKILVAQDPYGASYDLPAGPTEQMLIADCSANPTFVAADLLSQAEHGADSQVILVCDNANIAVQVNEQIKIQLATLPRKDIAAKALANSCVIIVETIAAAFTIANSYAPEHLLLQIENPQQYLAQIKSAGSVFIGHWAAESVGDYASGTNHVLPTYGYAKNFSGLGLTDFMKRISFQELTPSGLINIADTVETLAMIEDLEAHRRAISIRRNYLAENSVALVQNEIIGE